MLHESLRIGTFYVSMNWTDFLWRQFILAEIKESMLLFQLYLFLSGKDMLTRCLPTYLNLTKKFNTT